MTRVEGDDPIIGVRGWSTGGPGTQFLYGAGVQGVSSGNPRGIGVDGQCDFGPGATGVQGSSHSGTGVAGISVNGDGVYAESTNGPGVDARSYNGSGVWSYGSFFARYFFGTVEVHGTLTKTMPAFKIDHPLDPANKYLFHSGVESSDMKNIYDGVVVLDANGEAIVELPTWFEALNSEFRYQLTSIGAPGPNLYIAEEISDQRFKIAGGTAGMKVCWQVTGNRKDGYAQANPLVVEQEKPTPERGHYLHPEVFGYTQEQSIAWVHHPAVPRRAMEEQQTASNTQSSSGDTP